MKAPGYYETMGKISDVVCTDMDGATYPAIKVRIAPYVEVDLVAEIEHSDPHGDLKLSHLRKNNYVLFKVLTPPAPEGFFLTPFWRPMTDNEIREHSVGNIKNSLSHAVRSLAPQDNPPAQPPAQQSQQTRQSGWAAFFSVVFILWCIYIGVSVWNA